MKLNLIVLFLLVAMSFSYSTVSWWDTDFAERILVNVSEGSGIILTNYPVFINLTHQGNMQADFDDIRVLYFNDTGDGSQTLMEHVILSQVDSSYADLWFNMTDIPADGNGIVYIYFNNSAATNIGNTNETFDLYNTFEGNDTSGWNGDPIVNNVKAKVGNWSVYFENGLDVAWRNVQSIPDKYGWNVSFFFNCDLMRPSAPCTRSPQNASARAAGSGTGINLENINSIRNITSSSWVDTSDNLSTDTWHYEEFYCNQTQSLFYRINDSTQTENNDFCTLGLNNFSMFQTGITSKIYIDQIIIRKQVTPEPTTSLNEIEAIPQIAICGAGDTVVLNMTLKNEETRSQEFADMEIVVLSWPLGNKDSLTENVFSFDDTTSETLCTSNDNSTLEANVTIFYGNTTGFADREHYLINFNLTDSINFVDLFLLETSLATFLEVTIQDQAAQPVADVIVAMKRLYNGTNLTTISMVRTDSDGKGLTFAIDKRTSLKTVIYRFDVFRNDETLAVTVASSLSSDPDTSIITKVITLGLSVGELYSILDKETTACTNTSSTLVCTYTDNTGKLESVRFLVHRNRSVGFEVLCDETQTGDTGSFQCSLGTSENQTYQFQMVGSYEGGSTVILQSGTLFFGSPSIFGAVGAFISILFILPLAFIGRSSPPMAIFMMLVGVVGLWIFGLLFVDLAAIIALVLAGATAMWFMHERRP